MPVEYISRGRVNKIIAGTNVTINPTTGDADEVTINAAGGSGAPTDADYLVGTANAGLSAEIVVGTSPGGELGGTWASPTVDATHSGSTHQAATTTHEAAADPHTGYQKESERDATGGYTGLTLFKINFKNAANTFINFLTNATTAARTYTFPDKDITVAGLVDITGTNSGTNTGDQTLPVGGTPAIVLGTANTAGVSPNFLRRDDTILTFDATVPTTQAFADAAAVGTATVATRRDHKHAMMAAPTSVSGNAGSVTNATLTTALTVNTGTLTLTANSANTSILTIGAGAVSVSGANTGDNTVSTSGAATTAVTLLTARNIGGRSFNGSADIVAATWKTGITTRDITTASGTVNVAHGLSRVPSMVRVTASLVQAANTTETVGCYDGTNHSGLCTIQQEGTSTAITDTIYSSTAFELGFSAAAVVNPYTGINRQTATITTDATNIIFTWTKTGTVASAVANIMWEAT